MAHLHEADRILRAVERSEQAVDAIPWISIDRLDAPGLEPFDNVITDSASHTQTRCIACARTEFSQWHGRCDRSMQENRHEVVLLPRHVLACIACRAPRGRTLVRARPGRSSHQAARERRGLPA